MVSKSGTCKKYNSLGECIEWEVMGNSLVSSFKDAAKSCNKQFYEQYKKAAKSGNIRVAVPAD